jgi:hypothetical protein
MSFAFASTLAASSDAIDDDDEAFIASGSSESASLSAERSTSLAEGRCLDASLTDVLLLLGDAMLLRLAAKAEVTSLIRMARTWCGRSRAIDM